MGKWSLTLLKYENIDVFCVKYTFNDLSLKNGQLLGTSFPTPLPGSSPDLIPGLAAVPHGDFSPFVESKKYLNYTMTWLQCFLFRLDALAKALSVIATATWLGGRLGVRHTPVLYQNG